MHELYGTLLGRCAHPLASHADKQSPGRVVAQKQQQLYQRCRLVHPLSEKVVLCICLFCLLQAAPRDALIGDLSPAASRSACFGFAQSMRKWGSFMGAGLAFALMKASDNNYRAIFLLASGKVACSCWVVHSPVWCTDCCDVPCRTVGPWHAVSQVTVAAQNKRLAVMWQYQRVSRCQHTTSCLVCPCRCISAQHTGFHHVCAQSSY